MAEYVLYAEVMKTGLSKIRNKGIAAAFSYMNLVEAWGSGIPKIFRDAMEYGLKEPELIDMGSDFRVNLYRNPASEDRNIRNNPEVSGSIRNNPEASGNFNLSDNEIIVAQYINENKECASQLIAQKLNITDRYARMILGGMVTKHILQKTGQARNTAYVAGELFPDALQRHERDV